MSGILNYNKGLFSTQDFRNSLLSRNLPPPVNETLTQSGLVSKLQDIGNVISVPIFGAESENIPTHYNENERLFPLGTFFRNTKNVNLNSYVPQNDEYITYELTIPPNLGYPLPEGFGEKERLPYPTSYSTDRFSLINDGVKKGVSFPFNVIDSFKSKNFQTESSLGLIGGQELEKSIIDKIAQIEEESNPNVDSTGFITQPIGNMVDNYVNTLRGNNQFFNTLPNDAVGWNEYNSSNIINGGSPDNQQGVEPTMSTEVRMKSLLERTSVTQIQYTFNLLNRNRYRPLYEDRRLQGTSDEGTNGRYYIGTEKNTNRGSLITKTFDSSDFNGEVDTSGNGQRTTIEGIGEPFGEPNKFFWTTGGEQNFNPKTLLYKTQQLVNNNQDDVFINQTRKFFKDKKQDRLISRGNAISEIELFDAFSNGSFCRVWTVNDRYSYLRAIRNTGLFTSSSGTTRGFSATSDKSTLSVLMENGIPKYHPTIADSSTTRKKFMFSIENLAWTDNLADLPLSEIGPGDILSGNKGRIMWFPPYGLTFDESSNANWTSNEFLGRGEPVYTYNNASRSATISFKILVDHPRVINGYRGKSNNLLERFFAGCVTPDNLLSSLDSSVSISTKNEIETKLKEKKAQKVSNTLNKQGKGTIKYATTYDISQFNNVVSNIQSFLTEQATTSDPKVKITVNGYSKEKSKAKEFANEIKDLLRGELGTKNIKYITNSVSVDTNPPTDQVEVIWNVDVSNSQSAQPKEEEKTNPAGTYDPAEVKLIDSILIDENAYFDFIDGNYPNYFRTISEKIKYFHPGFHSITPEGLNSRLTFLNQCLRQGPSIYDRQTNVNGEEVGIQPQNLSFGRPPICILRIGDFFHTKMKINSLGITYDGPQFDLNPEGIGVQPMIASISLSVDLIGGHSLAGPINRLQNALSFNYYANTEIYDVRADSIKEGSLVDGIRLGDLKRDLLGATAVDALVRDLKTEGTVKQGKDSNNDNDNADGNGDDVIEIVSNGENSITIKTKGDIAPADIVVNKEPNPSNKLGWEITNISGDDKKGEITNSSKEITINFDENNLINPNGLFSLELLESNASQTLETAKNNFKTFKTSSNKIAFETAKKNYDDAKKNLDTYKKDFKDSIKVTAFLTENKSKTKKVKTFTITKDGLK